MIYDEGGTECALCLVAYLHGTKVCRIQRGPTFHAFCWQICVTNNYKVVRARCTQIRCPNCGCGPNGIIHWNRMNHVPLAQYTSGSDGLQADNQHDSSRQILLKLVSSQAQVRLMHTPGSMHNDYEYRSPFLLTPMNHSPRSQSPHHSWQQAGNFLFLLSTINDLND